jgi:inosine-uridine nucleoside N-ribohydrolase
MKALQTLLLPVFLAFPSGLHSQSSSVQQRPQAEKIIIDSDIGGDIDDAYAIALAVQSPELKIIGISVESKDTQLQARLVRRMLIESGHSDIVVATGVAAREPAGSVAEVHYAEGGPANEHYPDAIGFMLKQIRDHPGEITVISIGPLTDLAAALDRDAVIFRKVKRIIIMGGSVYRGYNVGQIYLARDSSVINHKPDLEYNIAADISAAEKIFNSGLPIFVLPLDSTQIKLEEIRRSEIFKAGTPITDSLALQHLEWTGGNPASYPATLFDAVAVAYAINPNLCPMTRLDLRVDDRGMTVVGKAAPHAFVCLHSDSDEFYDFFMPRILRAR